MELPSAELLARFQFAFTITFHIVYPVFTIGLASYLAVLNWRWLATRDQTYLNLFEYWKKIFAICFGMGVVSGVVMTYQFGTNWAVFADRSSPIIGPLMAYEVLTAFFLEAGFLGIMLFGRHKVGEGAHMLATALVAVGTATSAFWILSANSWMQTPVSYEIASNGQFHPVDWFEVVFNPSFPYRLFHMLTAAYLTTALVVGAVGAYHLLKTDKIKESRLMFSMAMWMIVITAPLQIITGHYHGENTIEHQPVKIMAMEGHFDSYPQGNAPFHLFGIPNQDTQELDYAISVPGLGSLVLHSDINAPVAGLDTVNISEQPPVAPVFFAFRVMVGLGLLMLALGCYGAWSRWKNKLYNNSLLLKFAMLMGPSGFVAVIAGWMVTEIGRQPYTIYGLLRTSDSLSPVEAPAVAASLLAFVVVYFLVFGAGMVYIFKLMNNSPVPSDDPATTDSDGDSLSPSLVGRLTK